MKPILILSFFLTALAHAADPGAYGVGARPLAAASGTIIAARQPTSDMDPGGIVKLAAAANTNVYKITVAWDFTPGADGLDHYEVALTNRQAVWRIMVAARHRWSR